MKEINIDKILEIINIVIPDKNLTHDGIYDDITEIGMDSLTFINMIVALEEEFDIEIPDDYLLLHEMNSVDKIFSVLKKSA